MNVTQVEVPKYKLRQIRKDISRIIMYAERESDDNEKKFRRIDQLAHDALDEIDEIK